MLFTWDTTNLCIIFHWWHITSTLTLLISLVAIAILTAGYEVVREVSRKYESSSAEYANTLPSKYCPCLLSIQGKGRDSELRLDVPLKTMMMMVKIGAHFSGQGRALGNKRRRLEW